MVVSRQLLFSDGCLNCTSRCPRDFCHLPADLAAHFHDLGTLTFYPSHAVLFSEGQLPRGVYIPCSGRVKLSVMAKDGKTVIMKVAGDRELLGLSAVVSGRPSPFEATTMEPCPIKFIERELFLKFLSSSPDLALKTARILSREIGDAFDDVYQLLLARSSTEKLARLLLSWVANEAGSRDLRVYTHFTHEEIAQMIGSSRETVTRLFSDMKRRQLIRLDGATLVISNRQALKTLAT